MKLGMSITILSPGAVTTVQDLGRTGYQQFGVPVSGVCDPRAARIANLLAGNDEGEAVLECTLLGPAIRFNTAEVIAVTGGDLAPSLDGSPLPMYAAVAVKAGQVLRFGGPRTGCRAYIAFAGGLDIAPVMGSRSTYMKAAIGGYYGRKLQTGDVINLRDAKPALPRMEARRVPAEHAAPAAVHTLRVVMGPQDDAFTEVGVVTFLTGEYTVTNEFDRMGCRMDGPAIRHKDGGDIISDGIAFGAIQVPGHGRPIIMLADRQTTGGYTKIANVITADFGVLGQLKAGDKVRFARVTVQEAQSLLARQREELARLKNNFR